METQTDAGGRAEMKTGKLYKAGHSLVLAIPARLRAVLGWRPGTTVSLDARNKELILKQV